MELQEREMGAVRDATVQVTYIAVTVEVLARTAELALDVVLAV